MQTDFVMTPDNLEQTNEVPIVTLLPKSLSCESWIVSKFEYWHVHLCSVTVTGLPRKPFELRRHPYSQVMEWIYTCAGHLPVGHRGLIGAKSLWRDRAEDGSQAFSGLVHLLWSSSVLAARCCKLLHGHEFRHNYPVFAVKSEKAFVFSQMSEFSDSCRVGHHIWSGMRRFDGQTL